MIQSIKQTKVKLQKPTIVSWNTWRKGLNTLLRETEVDGQEMVVSQNLMLVGSGVPTKRWGSTLAFQAGTSNASIFGVSRFIFPVKDDNDNIQILSWTDAGYLTKQSGMSYTQLQGMSWTSGYNLEAAELGGNVYIVNGQQPLVKYNFSNLISFATLSVPTSLTATNLSGVTGTSTFGWAVTAVSPAGETIGSNVVSLSNLPQNLNTTVRVNWSPITPGAGATLAGYNIYRGPLGTLSWVGGVGPTVTQFDDNVGYDGFGIQLLPIVDTTAGPVAKYIIRFQDRIILAGIPGSPTKILISGQYPRQERFDYLGGGGSILIEPDSGEDITGLGVYYRTISATQTIVVFKERSVWEVVIDTQTVGNNLILNPTYRLLTASQGCSSHRSITPVENDIFFANKRGIYILRYEPQLYNVINANELSAKIRPFFLGLNYSDISASAGFYADKKYVLSFPTTKQAIVFDRERLSFTGPWTFPFSPNMWRSYIDTAGSEHWLAASSSDNNVYEFATAYADDFGTPIKTSFKSRKEDFGDWTLFKSISEVFMNFRNVTGSVQVNLYIENRAGQVVVAKSFTVVGAGSQGTSGMGTDELGLFGMGSSGNSITVTPGELQKKAIMYQTGRTIQVEVLTSHNADDYELLDIKSLGLNQARDNNPSFWNT